jgi:hypothetical protein
MSHGQNLPQHKVMHNERTWPLPEKEVHRENEAITVSSCSSEEVQSAVFLLGEIQLKQNEPGRA